MTERSIHDVKGMSAFSFRGVERLLLAGYCNTQDCASHREDDESDSEFPDR